MRIIDSCAKCLYDRQLKLTDNQDYLKEIKSLLDNRTDTDVSPYMVYQFNLVYEKYFGKRASYEEEKKKYNDLILSMEDKLRSKINASNQPLELALSYSRIGNYIDFGAMNQVDEETFLSLFKDTKLSEHDFLTFESFVKQCETAKNFLLIADNCGEIVLDKLLIEQLKKAYPALQITVLVRGGEALNDATSDDAIYVGLDKVAKVVGNGLPVAGTIYHMLPDEAKSAIDNADVILSKGQGNYESLSGQGRHVFYLFLCKCELFTSRFNVPRLTGMFVEENKND